jgi:hypothetical protein
MKFVSPLNRGKAEKSKNWRRKKYPFNQPIKRQHSYIRWNYIQIYPGSEGYLRKIPVERRDKFHEQLQRRGNFACPELI